MLEAGHVIVRQIEWHVGISVVDSTKFTSFKVGLQVVLYNWGLNVSCVLSTSSLTIDAVTKGEDIVVDLVLECVWAHIDHTVLSSNT